MINDCLRNINTFNKMFNDKIIKTVQTKVEEKHYIIVVDIVIVPVDSKYLEYTEML